MWIHILLTLFRLIIMDFMKINVLSLGTVIIDGFVVGFLLWRIFDKHATLWGAAKFIYGWVTFLSAYHLIIYLISMIVVNPEKLFYIWLHPIVMLYSLNIILLAIVQWRGGHLP
jgi:hypothetical protein